MAAMCQTTNTRIASFVGYTYIAVNIRQLIKLSSVVSRAQANMNSYIYLLRLATFLGSSQSVAFNDSYRSALTTAG